MKVVPLKAHEMSPSILDLTINPNVVQLKIRFSVEAMLAEIDLSEVSDTNLSENAVKYDELRTFTPKQIKKIFGKKWSNLSKDIELIQSGRAVELSYQDLTVPDVGNTDLTRISHLYLEAKIEKDEPVIFSWHANFGPIVVRQMGVDNGLTQFLANGDESDEIFFQGSIERNKVQTFLDYIIVGFEHIIPKGWDHIVFVLGLFFFLAS